jgi:hypothetical protein
MMARKSLTLARAGPAAVATGSPASFSARRPAASSLPVQQSPGETAPDLGMPFRPRHSDRMAGSDRRLTDFDDDVAEAGALAAGKISTHIGGGY